MCKFSASNDFVPEFAGPGAAVAIGSGAQPFAAALEKFPALQGEPEPTNKALERFGGTVASSAFAIALAHGGAVGPRLCAFDRALTNTLNVKIPLAGLSANFTTSDDGSFDFSIERPDGRRDTIAAFVSRQQGEAVLARSAEFKREDYAENLPGSRRGRK